MASLRSFNQRAKVFNSAWSEDKFWDEILKCVPLCSNCHTLIHKNLLCLLTNEGVNDLPYRIQTTAGHRKYLCSGLYMPSVTTVLSATESEKSKAGLRTWQKNNPGALEEAINTRQSAIHLGCENYLRGLIPMSLKSISHSGMASANTWTGLTLSIGLSDHYVPIGITFGQTIERWLMSGALSIYMLAALTSSVKSVVCESLLTLKLVTLLTARLFPIVVTALASVALENIKNVLNKWRHTA